jgi:hypothetical protein
VDLPNELLFEIAKAVEIPFEGWMGTVPAWSSSQKNR